MSRFTRLFRSPAALERSIIVFCLFLLVIVWCGALWQAGRDRQTAIETVWAQNDKFALAFEEHVRRVLKTNEQYLEMLKIEYERRGVTPALRDVLAQIAADPLVTQASVLNEQGRPVVSALPVNPAASFADMPHFVSHRNADTGRLYIGKAAFGRVSNKYTIQLSRRINHADGSFGGICTIAISPFYFSQFYQAMRFDESYTVRLTGLDRIVRASNDEREINADITGSGLWSQVAASQTGWYYADGSAGRPARFYSYRVVEDYPLVVQVGMRETALVPLYQRLRVYYGIVGGLSLLIVAFMVAVIAAARRQRHSEQELQASYEQLSAAHEELTATEEELRNNYNQLNNERAFTAAVIDSVPGLLYLYDATGRLVRWNKNHETATGYSAAELADMRLTDWYRNDPETIERITREVAKAFAAGEAVAEAPLQNKDGSRTTYYFTAVKIDINEQPYIVGIGIDITKLKQAEAALLEKEQALQRSMEDLTASHEKLHALYSEVVTINAKLESSRRTAEEIFHAAGDGFVVCDGATGEILAVNRRMTEILGYSEAEFKQHGVVLVSTPANQAEALNVLKLTVTQGKQPLYERETRHKDGHRVILEVSSTPVEIEGNICILGLMRDISARRQLEENMEFLRQKDPLTGVYNRAYFETDMARIKTGLHADIGIIVCDVDGLKLINDTLGHRQGDELLRKVAGLLAAGVNEPSYVARIGGDELAVVVFQATPARLGQLEKHYQDQIDTHNQSSPHLPLSVSMGWAVGGESADVEVIFKTADNNMYRQKLHRSQSVRGSIVRTMMAALEEKDHITEGHADRLSDLMEQMGRFLDLPQVNVADMRLLAKFHDIGKVGIPDSILKKRGRLSDDEMAIMRQHCEIGYRIAKSSPDLEPIADWILKHQEHWDGRGYPLGISGEQIPIECRILGIIDAFDAMTSDRPYRKAMDSEAARQELLRCAGSQFDPALVKVFISLQAALR